VRRITHRHGAILSMVVEIVDIDSMVVDEAKCHAPVAGHGNG
jgi:hypothetical protein